MALNEKQKELIERIGVFHEHKGLQPLHGRIIGLMLVHEKAEVTFEEIVDLLGVSKSAVSNALNFLQAKERVTYHTKPGDRKRYFTLQSNNWQDEFEKELQGITKFQEFIDEVLELRGDRTEEFNCSLRELSRFLGFFKAEVPQLLEKFRRKIC